jgi:hypothetical protein
MSEPLDRIEKGWPAIKQVPWHFFGAVAVLVGVGWLVISLHYSMVMQGKDAELGQKNETIRTISEERNKTDRDNEKLLKQISDLRIYRGQDAPPLKKKALILAQQIRDFTQDWKDTDTPGVKIENVYKYASRFGIRASLLRDDLDQNGQQSDTFDKVMYNFRGSYEDVRTIAAEVERLAKKLPE